MFTRRQITVLFLILGCAAGGPVCGSDTPAPAPLESASAVRALSAKAAADARPVKLRGNLLLITVPRNAVVLLDGTEGIYVELDRPVDAAFRFGDVLEVAGVTNAGDFAPIVRASRIERVGAGTPVPPRPTSIADLNAGGYDAAWIEMIGIVRSCAPTPSNRMPVSRAGTGATEGGGTRESWLVTFSQGDDKMEVQINGPVVPGEIVDAVVRLRGVVFNVHNANRQFIRASLQVPDRSMIEVLAPPLSDPFALPVMAVGEVLRFSPRGFTGHRVHVRGVVTAHKDGHTLWIREGERGMQVASAQEGNLSPGDEVQVVGFPDHGSYTPSLSDAIFRKIASGSPPVPQPLDRPEAISRHDSNLVQIDATLRDLRSDQEGLSLILDWQGLEVHALLQRGAEDPAAVWEPGSVVRVTGICIAGRTNFLRPTGLWLADDLQLWLRSPADVRVLRPAPWLTTGRAFAVILAVMGAMLLALLAMAVVARREIRQREQARKLAEAQFAAMLAERNRLAREIHDTLAQELNAVSMQLELAKNAARSGGLETVMQFAGAAHEIVRRCLASARESIWDMRSHILESHDLVGALCTVAEQLRGGMDCAIAVRVQGRARRLAPTIENNLLRIGQEAVSNALKHARPKAIDLEFYYDAEGIRLVVSDDGPGFDVVAPEPAGSHFGLRGMRERVAKINGTLNVGRRDGGGTCVEIRVESPEPM